MDASELEGLLYNMLSEEPFTNHIFDMIDERDGYNISDYVSHYFDITILETWTCLSCNAKNQILNDDSFIFSLEEISQKVKKMRPISHEKKTHLGKLCYHDRFDGQFFLWKTELSDIICEEFSNSSGLICAENFGKKKSVLKSPIQLRISLQRSNFNYEKNELSKKNKSSLPVQYSMSFPDEHH